MKVTVYKCPRCGWTDFISNIPKEKEIEKIQMTEEQAYDLFSQIYHSNSWKDNLETLKQKGYIRKSELQTLVDESESLLATMPGLECKIQFSHEQALILQKTFQALIKENERLKIPSKGD